MEPEYMRTEFHYFFFFEDTALYPILKKAQCHRYMK